ncbi:MAG: lysostaphin resistance A-like protein [Cytophagales bacterium]
MLINQSSRHPLVLIIVLLLFFIAGLFISQFLIFGSLYPFIGDKVMDLASIVANPNEYQEYKYVLLYVQGMTSFGSMILAPILFLQYFYKHEINYFVNMPREIFFFLTAILVIVSMPANAWIAEQNMQMKLPAFLIDMERWMAGKEAELKILTEYLTTFQTNTQFLVGLVVIALIPAIGEELLFRAGLQNLFNDAFKNKHVAIWLAAIIFSGIHLQFYGFFPRMFLGALFGYLYLWSGNILIPMTGHFVNNGFTLLLIHLKNVNQIKVDLETTQDIPTGLIVGSGFLFTALLVFFHRQARLARA